MLFDPHLCQSLETNYRSEGDIFEAMQDEFCVLVPVTFMQSLI